MLQREKALQELRSGHGMYKAQITGDRDRSNFSEVVRVEAWLEQVQEKAGDEFWTAS